MYEEQGVTVTDKNEDESTRTVKIEYSEPFGEPFAVARLVWMMTIVKYTEGAVKCR